GLGLLVNLVEYNAWNWHCLVNMETSCPFDSSFYRNRVRLFLERERAAQLVESKTDELIRDAPTTQHDESGERQERSGEMRRASTEKTDGTEEKQKEEDDEELDLNTVFGLNIFSSSACWQTHGGLHRGLIHSTISWVSLPRESSEPP
ncbi:Wings apart-like protein-like protein, partial [Camelus dromedarius]